MERRGQIADFVEETRQIVRFSGIGHPWKKSPGPWLLAVEAIGFPGQDWYGWL